MHPVSPPRIGWTFCEELERYTNYCCRFQGFTFRQNLPIFLLLRSTIAFSVQAITSSKAMCKCQRLFYVTAFWYLWKFLHFLLYFCVCICETFHSCAASLQGVTKKILNLLLLLLKRSHVVFEDLFGHSPLPVGVWISGQRTAKGLKASLHMLGLFFLSLHIHSFSTCLYVLPSGWSTGYLIASWE